MAQLTFFKNKSNNYYLTHVLLTEDEKAKNEFELPEYVIKDDKNYTYGIYKYAFCQVEINKIIIPETVANQINGPIIYPEAFDGSNIPNIELWHIIPPNMDTKTTIAHTFSNLAEYVNIIIPKNYNKTAYEARGFINDNDNNIVTIIISNSARIKADDQIIPSFYGFGEAYSNIEIAQDVQGIQDMAFLNIQNNSEEQELFTISNNQKFEASDGVGLIDKEDDKDKIIKGIFEGEGELSISNAILGPNSFSQVSNVTTVTFLGKRIESLAFQNCPNLNTLIIGATVEYIAPDAFLGCKKLKSISIVQGNSEYYAVSSQNNSCFLYNKINNELIFGYVDNTDDLNNFLLQIPIASIPAYFIGFKTKGTELEGKLTIPNTVIYIGREAFRHMDLTQVEFLEGNTDEPLIIDSCAFKQTKIEHINFGNRPIYIGAQAFYGMQLKSPLIIPNNIIEIGDNAFGGHPSWLSLYYSTDVANRFNNSTFGLSEKPVVYNEILGTEQIENWAQGNIKYTYYKLSDEIKLLSIYGEGRMPDWGRNDGDEIQLAPWRNDTEVKYIRVENGITTIGNYSFYNMTNVQEITIPSSIDATKTRWNYGQTQSSSDPEVEDPGIGLGAFWAASGLSKIQIKGAPKNYLIIADNLFSMDKTILYQHPINSDYIELSNIPKTTIELYNDSIRHAKNLTKVILPESLRTIQGYTFAQCEQLETVEGLENTGITEIKEQTFAKCSKLSKISLPSSIKTIAKNAFESCYELKEINLPESLTELDDMAFYACKKLKNITIPKNVKSIGHSILAFCESLESIQIEDNQTMDSNIKIINRSLYDNTTLRQYPVASNNQIYRIDNQTTIIGAGSFAKSKYLKTVTIPESIDTIGESAFAGCQNLTSIFIPENVTQIQNYAFAQCNNLTIYCEAESQPEGWLDKWNFTNCPVIWGVSAQYLISDENDINSNVMAYWCRGNYELIIDGVGDIKDYETDAMGKPNTPWVQGQEEIWCKTIIVKDGVTKLGDYVFSHCQYTTAIKLSDSLKHIGNNAFSSCKRLESLIIPLSVETTGSFMFINTGANLPDGEKCMIYCEATSKPNGWNSYWNGASNYCSFYWYRDTKPNEEGNFWHYNDNHEPEIWEK